VAALVPSVNQTVWLSFGGRLAPTRVLRRVHQTLYVDALREGERDRLPFPGEVDLCWLHDNTFWAVPVSVEELLDPIPIVVVRLRGEARVVEQRGAPRAKVLVPLEYRLARPDAEVYTTTTLDLSWDGLRFPSAFRTWVGLELRLQIRVDGVPVPAVGRVVRVAAQSSRIRGREAWETAVQFVNLSPAHRARIRALVERSLERGRRRRKGGDAG
jgi:hypothetical protein